MLWAQVQVPLPLLPHPLPLPLRPGVVVLLFQKAVASGAEIAAIVAMMARDGATSHLRTAGNAQDTLMLMPGLQSAVHLCLRRTMLQLHNIVSRQGDS